MADITVVILTFNEQMHIARALASVRSFATRVVVVDSGSTDQTARLAVEGGAEVFVNPFVNQAKQFQWALDNTGITTTWIMRLDADEVISKALAAEVGEKLPVTADDVVGMNLRRRHVFMGKWIRHGGRYPLRLLRIWRTGHGRVEDRWMDEHIFVWGGKTIDLDHDFSDVNLNDLSFFVDKHNKYATREAIEVINHRLGLFRHDETTESTGTSSQAALKRWIKEKIYNRIPFGISSSAYFVWRYVFQLGFLDGQAGLIYHFMQGFWYRFLVGAKVVELSQGIANLQDKGEILAELSRLTGYRLGPQTDDAAVRSHAG